MSCAYNNFSGHSAKSLRNASHSAKSLRNASHCALRKPVSGRIEHGEDVFDALSREILEEMWLTVTYIEKQPKYFFPAWSIDWITPLALICYEVTVESFDYTETDECREMKFFTLEEALEEDIFPWVQTTLLQAQKQFWLF